MLVRTIAIALLAAAACLPASAAGTVYDRAASMAAGETSLARGYDGANAAGAVKASVSALPPSAGLIPAPQAPAVHPPASRTAMDSASVPSPMMRVGLGAAGAVPGAIAGGSLAGPIGAVLGGLLGFAIALMLSKALG